MKGGEVAAVEDFDAVIVTGGGHIVAIGRPINIVNIGARVIGAEICPRAGVPNTNEVILRTGDDEFARWRVIHAVVITAGTGGEFILVVWIADGPFVVEVGGAVSVSVGTSVPINRGSAG